jgi:hypothetical protein
MTEQQLRDDTREIYTVVPNGGRGQCVGPMTFEECLTYVSSNAKIYRLTLVAQVGDPILEVVEK